MSFVTFAFLAIIAVMNPNEANRLLVRPAFEFPQTPWGLRDLLFAILLAAGGIVALNLGVLALSLWLNLPVRENGAWLAIFVVVQDLIVVGAAWLFTVVRYRVGWERLGLRTFDVAFGCLMSAALFMLSYFVRICFVVTAMLLGWKLQPQQVLSRLDTSGFVFLLTLFSTAILAPVAEEIFFRGFIYSGLRGRIGVIGAMLASTFFFTTLHFSLDAFVPIFVLGLFLAWLYEKTGSLYPGIILHASNNAIAVIALFIMQAAGIKLQ